MYYTCIIQGVLYISKILTSYTPRPERLGGEYGTLTRTETDARTGPTRAKGGLGRGLHPERWGRVAFVWPEKPFRAVGDVYPVTYFPTPT